MQHKEPGYFSAIATVIWKDFAIEWRARQLLTSMLMFSILVILIFNFALDLNVRVRNELSAGILWATFAFAGTLGLNRSLALESENRALDGLLLAPVDRSALYFGKTTANLLFMLVVEMLTLPMYGLLYNVNPFHWGFLLVLLLGSWAYSAIGTLLSAMSAQTRSRDLLLPVLLFPLALPVLVSSVRASSAFLSGLEFAYAWPGISLLLAYGVIIPTLGYMFFNLIVEE
ncbi:MAG: heme exporter protein CcmB [Anaerolineales bacterium]